MCKVSTGYHGTSEIEHGLCACTVDNPLARARGLSLRTGAQTILYLAIVVFHFRCFGSNSDRQHVDRLRLQHKIICSEYFPLLTHHIHCEPYSCGFYDDIFYSSAREDIKICIKQRDCVVERLTE